MEIILNPITIIASLITIIMLWLYLRDKYLSRIFPVTRFVNTAEVSKLSDENRKITVSYNNQEVPRVTTTSVWFWNKGKKPLKKEDISSNEPICFEFCNENDPAKQVDILDYNIVKFSREGSRVNLIRRGENDRLYLEFEYFDFKDGICFDVQHSGNVYTKLKLNGKVLGYNNNFNVIESFKEIVYLPSSLKNWFLRSRMKLIFLLILWGIICIILFIPKNETVSSFKLTDLENYIYIYSAPINSDSTFINNFVKQFSDYTETTSQTKYDSEIMGYIKLSFAFLLFILIFLKPDRICLFNRIPRSIKLQRE